MRAFLFVFALMLSAGAYASIVSWSAGVAMEGRDTYQNGTAFFIQVSQDGPSLEEMISHITTNGLTLPENSGVDVLANGQLENGFYALYDRVIASGDVNATYYTLFVDESGKNFYFSIGAQLGDDEFMEGTQTPDGQWQYFAQFDEVGESDIPHDWLSNGGTVGDGTVDPNVPEPTALALLTLGVAGVALRRRIR